MCCLPNDVFLYLADFNGSTTAYRNKVMKGMRYRLIRDGDVVMKPTIDYDDASVGGFDLATFSMASDSVLVIQFY